MNFPILWVKTLKLKELEPLAQNHLGGNQKGLELNLDLS